MVHPPHRVCIWVSVSWAWRQKCLGMLFHTSPSSDAQLLSVMWEKQPDSPSFFLHQCKSSKLKRHLFNKTNLGRESRFQGCPDWMCFLSLNSLPQGSESTQDIVICKRRCIYVDVGQKQAKSKSPRKLQILSSLYFLCFWVILIILYYSSMSIVALLLIQLQALLLYIVYLISDSRPSSLFSSNEMRGCEHFQRKSIVLSHAAALKHSLS